MIAITIRRWQADEQMAGAQQTPDALTPVKMTPKPEPPSSDPRVLALQREVSGALGSKFERNPLDR